MPLRSQDADARHARLCSQPFPDFARSVGMAALKWLLCGYGYDLTAQDVANALNHTLEAARNEGSEAGTIRSIQQLIEQHPGADPPSLHRCTEGSIMRPNLPREIGRPRKSSDGGFRLHRPPLNQGVDVYLLIYKSGPYPYPGTAAYNIAGHVRWMRYRVNASDAGLPGDRRGSEPCSRSSDAEAEVPAAIKREPGPGCALARWSKDTSGAE